MGDKMNEYIYKKINDLELKFKIYRAKESIGNIIYVPGGGLLYSNNNDLPINHIHKFNNSGYNIISLSYRLCPESDISDILCDIKDAFSYILKNRQSLNLNNNKFFLLGRSAGSYLIIKTLTSNDLFLKKFKAILSFYGYGFLFEDWAHFPNKYYSNFPKVNDITINNLINNFEVSNIGIDKRYSLYLYARQTGKWLKLLSNKPTPEFYNFFKVSKEKLKNLPPTLLIHNKNDPDVPYKESIELKKYINNSKLLLLNTYDHAFDNNINNKFTMLVLNKSVTFLNKHI